MATDSPKVVRFDEMAMVYRVEVSDSDSDSDVDEGVYAGRCDYTSSFLATDWFGSPFDVVCQIVEGIYARGGGLTEAVSGHEATFEIDTSASPGREVLVTVRDTQDNDVACNVEDQGHGLFKVEYTPKNQGMHTIEVLYDGVNIPSSPFTVDVKKPKVYVQDFPVRTYVGKEATFKIDANEMKQGVLEIDSSVPVKSYDKLSQNIYRVTIVPKRVGMHDMIIKYNGAKIEGCPFKLEVKGKQRR